MFKIYLSNVYQKYKQFICKHSFFKSFIFLIQEFEIEIEIFLILQLFVIIKISELFSYILERKYRSIQKKMSSTWNLVMILIIFINLKTCLY